MFSHKPSLSVNTMFPCLLSKNFLATFYNEKKCVCVCVRENERKRGRTREGERGKEDLDRSYGIGSAYWIVDNWTYMT